MSASAQGALGKVTPFEGAQHHQSLPGSSTGLLVVRGSCCLCGASAAMQGTFGTSQKPGMCPPFVQPSSEVDVC